jgi:hypothetical protein
MSLTFAGKLVNRCPPEAEDMLAKMAIGAKTGKVTH